MDVAAAAPSFDSAWATNLDAADLPVLPDVTEQVLRMASDPQSSLQDLAQVLSRDAAIAANIMRLANSPLYRGREPIVTLHQAAARLGTMKLRDVAVLVASESRLFRARGFEVEARQAFTHGLLTGLWAQELARRLRGAVEEAFLAGLLHDVGTPLLLQAACDRIVNPGSCRDQILLVVAQRHASVGADLCRRWRLPERLAITLLHHHDALPNAAGTMGETIALADDLADACEQELDEQALVARTSAHPAAARLNLYDDDIVGLVRMKDTLVATAGAVTNPARTAS